MSMMASAAPENSPTPVLTVGVVAVTLPADGFKLRRVWIDQQTLLVGFDPEWLTFDLVARIVREQYGVDVTVMTGVPQ